MKCPECNIDLMMTERQGVEIDYCTRCRGVWLDRGELDKIIERSQQLSAPSYSPPPPAADRGGILIEPEHTRDYEGRERDPRYRDDDRYYDDRGSYDKHGKRKKREGFLSELFDFD
jgi:Zn-finger nucleic acid-binding protein